MGDWTMIPLTEVQEAVIPGCSKCRLPLEAMGYDGDLECPNAQYPNKTRHGRYTQIDLKAVIVGWREA